MEDGGNFVVERVGDFYGDAAGDGGFYGLAVDFWGVKETEGFDGVVWLIVCHFDGDLII